MGQYKMTWFFEGLQNATLGAGAAVGWTETWGLNQASNNIDDAFTNADVTNYTNLRANCLSNQYRISFLRAVEIPQPGTIAVRRVKIASLANVQGGLSNPTAPGAQVQCSILLDLQKLPSGPGDKVHHRKFLLRGLSTDVINGNVINPAAASWTAYKTFFDFIGNKPTGGVHGGGFLATMLGVTYQDQVNFPKIACPAITVDGANPRVISINPGLTAFVQGDVIRITGWSGLDGVSFNRAWTFISQQAGPPIAAFFGRSRFDMEPGTSAFPNPAFYQRVRLITGPFDQYAIIGLRNKRTGGVFHRLRGRSSRKVRP